MFFSLFLAFTLFQTLPSFVRSARRGEVVSTSDVSNGISFHNDHNSNNTADEGYRKGTDKDNKRTPFFKKEHVVIGVSLLVAIGLGLFLGSKKEETSDAQRSNSLSKDRVKRVLAMRRECAHKLITSDAYRRLKFKDDAELKALLQTYQDKEDFKELVKKVNGYESSYPLDFNCSTDVLIKNLKTTEINRLDALVNAMVTREDAREKEKKECLDLAEKILIKSHKGEWYNLRRDTALELFSDRNDANRFNALLQQMSPYETYVMFNRWSITESLKKGEIEELDQLSDKLSDALQEKLKLHEYACKFVKSDAYLSLSGEKNTELKELLSSREDKGAFKGLIKKVFGKQPSENCLWYLNADRITDKLKMEDIEQLVAFIQKMVDAKKTLKAQHLTASDLLKGPTFNLLKYETGAKLAGLLENDMQRTGFLKILKDINIRENEYFRPNVNAVAIGLKTRDDMARFSTLIAAFDKLLKKDNATRIKTLLEGEGWTYVKKLTNKQVLELLETDEERERLQEIISSFRDKEISGFDINSATAVLDSRSIGFLATMAASIKKKSETTIVLEKCNARGEDEQECSVCLNEYTEGKEVFSYCGEMRHHVCAKCSQGMENRCPTCRQSTSILRMKFIAATGELRKVEEIPLKSDQIFKE